MANVNPIDGVKYGFRLMGYTIAVFVGGMVIAAIGARMAEDAASGGSVVLGALIAIFGVAVIYAGMLGMAYKIIADAVEKGIRSADGPVSAAGSRAARQPSTGRATGQHSGGGPAGRQGSAGRSQQAGGQQTTRSGGGQRSGNRQSGDQRTTGSQRRGGTGTSGRQRTEGGESRPSRSEDDEDGSQERY